MEFNKRRLRVLEKYSPQCVNDFRGDFRLQNFLDKESIVFDKKASKIALKIANKANYEKKSNARILDAS